MSSKWLFVKAALKRIRVNGSVVPSSKYLARQLLKPISSAKAVTVVELGAGTGSLTKEIAKRLSRHSSLILFEINNDFVVHLKKTFKNDKRIIIIHDDVSNITKNLRHLGIKEIDYIISGLPLNNFTDGQRKQLYSEIDANLSKSGVYLQFQYFLSNWLELRKRFNSKIYAFEPRNFPPAFLYKCTKV